MAEKSESEHDGHELCSTTDRDTDTFCVSILRVRLKPQKRPDRPKAPVLLDPHSLLSYPINPLVTSNSHDAWNMTK
jgi:hypothetical protein